MLPLMLMFAIFHSTRSLMLPLMLSGDVKSYASAYAHVQFARLHLT